MAERGKLDEDERKVNTYEPEDEMDKQDKPPQKQGGAMFKKRGKNKLAAKQKQSAVDDADD